MGKTVNAILNRTSLAEENMSDGWAKHNWRNDWIPLASAKPQPGQAVEVWAFTDALTATYHADGTFRTVSGAMINYVTHWRNGPAQTDGLLASGDNRQCSDNV